MRTALLLIPLLAWSQDRPTAADRPPLFFREDWKETEAELPITPAHVANPDLVLSLHGPGKAGIKKSHHDKPADDPFYVWSGECRGNWAVSLRHRSAMVDLRGQARIRIRSMQQGFRQLRIILQLADGTWLVSDQSEGPSRDWRVAEFNLVDIRWRKLDMARVAEAAWVDNPDLSRVREIGFTDLMAGGGSAACSRLDWIEVHGRRVNGGS
jgi:hypothetical protein